jgi:hypothetical protein
MGWWVPHWIFSGRQAQMMPVVSFLLTLFCFWMLIGIGAWLYVMFEDGKWSHIEAYDFVMLLLCMVLGPIAVKFIIEAEPE